MSTLNRLIGMAGKALGQQSSSTSGSASGGDWRQIVRTAADRLTGDDRAAGAQTPPPSPMRSGPSPAPSIASAADLTAEDRRAIARYDYLVQTAEPQELERIHREAFARLAPEQRAEVEARMRSELPPTEQPRSGSPDDLARAATRVEVMRPGSVRGLLARAGGSGRGRGIGGAVAGAGVGLAAGGILATVAGGAVLSTVAAPLLDRAAGLGVDFDALAGGLDLGAIAGVDELASGVGEQVSGVGDSIGSLGEQASDFSLGDLGDLFGR